MEVRDGFAALAEVPGAVSVIDLVDAQSQSLIAELAAADARYRFMVDHLRAERAVGMFTFERDRASRDDLYHRLRAHIEKRMRDDPNAGEETRELAEWFMRRYPTFVDRCRYATRKHRELTASKLRAGRPAE